MRFGQASARSVQVSERFLLPARLRLLTEGQLVPGLHKQTFYMWVQSETAGSLLRRTALAFPQLSRDTSAITFRLPRVPALRTPARERPPFEGSLWFQRDAQEISVAVTRRPSNRRELIRSISDQGFWQGMLRGGRFCTLHIGQMRSIPMRKGV